LKAVLDENVPRQIIPHLRNLGCDVSPFPKHWRGLKNGQLLLALEGSEYGCLVTCDKNLVKQQNLAAKQIAVVVLPTQELATLESIAHGIAKAAHQVLPGQFIAIPR
jgi:hypothetical protein